MSRHVSRPAGTPTPRPAGVIAGLAALLAAAVAFAAITRRRSGRAPVLAAMSDGTPVSTEALAAVLKDQLISPAGTQPAATILAPVNAQGDLSNIRRLLGDLGAYGGSRRFDIVLVVNNYPDGSEPPELAELPSLGVIAIGIPDVRVPGEAVGFSARIPGARRARTDALICFDADCRVPDPTALLDWYVDSFDRGVDVAYSHVAYHSLRRHPSIQIRMLIHHATRWIKRVILRIPTVRGSNYAIRRSLLIRLYDSGYLADDFNVGPVARHAHARIAYSGDPQHVVLTSGRMFRGGWGRLWGYVRYRFRYNARVLRVRPDAARHTGRESDPVRRYVDDDPV